MQTGLVPGAERSSPLSEGNAESCWEMQRPPCRPGRAAAAFSDGAGRGQQPSAAGASCRNPSSAGHAAKLPAAISRPPLFHHLRVSSLRWLFALVQLAWPGVEELSVCRKERGRKIKKKKKELWAKMSKGREKRRLCSRDEDELSLMIAGFVVPVWF